MSDSNHHQWQTQPPRISSPFSLPSSSPPGRTPPLARPDWPWSQASPLRYRSSHLTHPQRSSSSGSSSPANWDLAQSRTSVAASVSSGEGSVTSSSSMPSSLSRSASSRTSWQSNQTLRNNAGSSLASYVTATEETAMQWTFMVRPWWHVTPVNPSLLSYRALNGSYATYTNSETSLKVNILCPSMRMLGVLERLTRAVYQRMISTF